ncbi:MAG: DNA polymerase/3'-5' exonuclease PolX [Candidatus Nanohaloarchaea archaeon]|nr:DNA polymerase/3'-5' exonuclease PolX [Candidatus Nanohaloarchaea archaeon]
MKNKEVADILYEIADLLEMQDVEWKPRAYRRAARSVEALSEPVEDVHDRGELQEIEGVGEAIAGKISEYLETGELGYYQDLKQELPVDIEALTAVEGVGPKTARKLYRALDVRDLDDLEAAAENGEIAELEGFGEKTQDNILAHIEQARKGEERMLLGAAFPIAETIQDQLAASENFGQVQVVGSFRRRRPTVGDIDVLATAEAPEAAMDEFCGMDDVKEVLGRGDTKASIIVAGGLRMDLRIVDAASWGAALLYFTGSKDHNIALRDRAIDRGWKLNEYGLFDTDSSDDGDGQRAGELIAGRTEEEVYRELGLAYIAPELREDTGEVAAAADGELPDLVEQSEIRGDLQLHTTHSDGNESVAAMAEKADEKGYDYILVTDHGPALHIAGGPSSVDELAEQAEEIQAANEAYDVTVLHGIEANITRDGIDVGAEMLEMLDLVVVAMHDRLDSPTERVLDVFETQPVDVFAHPLNRKINSRQPADLDMRRIAETAVEENIALEINAQPERLDLPWDVVKQYRDSAMFAVSTDAHTTGEMDFMHLGVSQARRGWLEADSVVNTRSLDDMMSCFS